MKVADFELSAATRSPSTTPPVFETSAHESAAAFATKLFDASRSIEYTVNGVPAAKLCAGTTVPLPSAAVSTRIFVAGPALIVTLPKVPVLELAELAVHTREEADVAALLDPGQLREVQHERLLGGRLLD